MEQRPQLGVIDVERVAGRVMDDARDDLRGFDRHLPARELQDSEQESQRPADHQDSEWLQMFEYWVLRIIAKPLMSSRMPASSENAGLKPVRSIFSFDTM